MTENEIEALKAAVAGYKAEIEKLKASSEGSKKPEEDDESTIPVELQKLLDAATKKEEEEKKTTIDPDLASIKLDIPEIKKMMLENLLAGLDAKEKEAYLKIVDGMGLVKARSTIEALKSLKPKPTPVGGLPASSTGGTKVPGYYDKGYKHTFVDERIKS